MQEVLIPGRRTALWLALAASILPSRALELGPVEVNSALGEKLDARIPLRAREGEWFHAKCLALTRDAIPGVPPLADGILSVERRRASTHPRVRSAEPVNDPALAFGVSSTCAAETPQVLGAPITVLLDLPRVDRATPAKPTPPPRAAAMRPAPTEQPRAAATPAPARPLPAPAPAPAPSPAQAAPKSVSPPAPAVAPKQSLSGGEFVLRLSSGNIDLARTRQFDDKSRARLRERLRLLDSDDQVAEMLSMRDNLRRLEARVAELQLKLATMPQSFPATPSEASPPKEPAKPPVTATAPSPAAVPPAATPAAPAPKAEAPVAVAPKVEAPAAVAPKVETPAAATPKGEAAVTAKTPVVALPAKVEPVLEAVESFEGRLIGLGIAILVLFAFLGAWLWSRWRNPPARDEDSAADTDPATVLMDRDEFVAEAPIEIAAPAPVVVPTPTPAPYSARAEVTSDAALATRLGDDTEALRRRYIEERFPEIRAGTISLDDPGSVIKGARLFYEDGAMPRAVELLRFAIEDRPDQVRPWLALFEIYRLERLSGEYGELAGRFRDTHGGTPQWAKVCSFGRELDPSNALYQEPPLKSLETIGPRAARQLAAAHADPLVENWLEAPMDFENEVLATELRRSLMSKARVEERDLVSNPMPALRSVEMFSVG